MENVMTIGFCELNENEMMMVDGGWDGDTNIHVGTDGIWIETGFNYWDDIYDPMYEFGGKLYDWLH